ncbi:MAG: hypothetical protein IPJ68_03085 [Candidatus Moraniibacteriota bacterium]|nr:MAG: hypothetical protein IPJ68_03085 [Candidatus Moranbacteria bacterium]
MPTLEQESNIAAAIADAAVHANRRPSPLKKVYLLIAGGPANRVEIILEVKLDAYDSYRMDCRFVPNYSVRPFSRDTLYDQSRRSEEWAQHAWARRTNMALKLIGVRLETLDLSEISAATDGYPLDVTCLPIGWGDENSWVYRHLLEDVQGSQDPGFLVRAREHRLRFFPLPA